MNQWLVRTSENWIAGPYLKDQICQMIVEGRLGLQDEVCSGNGYWVYIHERAEIKRLLGVDLPVQANAEEEITQTQLAPENEELTDPDITQVRTKTSFDAGSNLASTFSEKPSEQTPVISASTLNSIHSESVAALDPYSKADGEQGKGFSGPRAEVMGDMSRPSFWRGVTWIGIAACGILVIFLLRLLRSK